MPRVAPTPAAAGDQRPRPRQVLRRRPRARRRRPRGAAGHGARAARPQRRRQDDRGARPHDALSPTPGTARVAGLDVVARRRRLRGRIGLAGQYAAVDENLTGLENLSMVGRLYGMRRAAAKRRAAASCSSASTSSTPPAASRRPTRAACAGGWTSRRARRPPAGALPRRADDGPGPAQPPRPVGDDRGARGRGHDRPAHHPVPRRGRPAGRRIVVIDHGRVIAEGTPDELKDRVGGERLEVQLADAAAARRRCAALAPMRGQEGH